MRQPLSPLQAPEKPARERLDSWKEIAAYLRRDITTAKRWEKREALPVHRHLHDKRGSVYAQTGELDAWLQSRRPRPQPEVNDPLEQPAPGQAVQTAWVLPRPWFALAAVALLALLVATYAFVRRADHAISPQIQSLAVLPLKNLSADAGEDYLAEGITEELIDRLSRIHNLRVISHTSVMRFKNPQLSAPEIAKMLGVDALVEGSVRQEGSRIRVTAQLIRGATDEHFWSESYDRDLRDVLALQSDLAQTIADKVMVTVTGEEHERLAASRPVAPEVYESYLRGLSAYNRGNGKADLDESVADLQEAINKDPSFAPAYVGLAAAFVKQGTVFVGEQPENTRPEVVNAARKALELDPSLAGAHVLLADTAQKTWHWSEAESEYKQALELNPNDAHAHAGWAELLLCQGHTDEAVAWARSGRELDPLAVSGADIAWILFQSHRYDEALRELRSVLSVQPDDARASWHLGFTLIANDEPKEAIAPLEKALALTNRSPGVIGVLIRAYARAGRRGDAERLLAELKSRSKTAYIPAGAFVNAYLGLGEKEETFVWLDQAYKEQSDILQFVKVHPYFDPIRSDPRFSDLIHRVGLD